MKKKIKQRLLRIMAITICSLFLWNGNSLTEVKAAEQTDILGVVAGYDSTEEAVSVGAAVCLTDGSQGLVFSGIDAISEAAVTYQLLTDEGNRYSLEIQGYNEDMELVMWKITEGTLDNAFYLADYPYQGQAASFVYFDMEGNIQTTELVLSELIMGDYAQLIPESYPSIEIMVPGALVNSAGNCIGIVTADAFIWAPMVDETVFYEKSGDGAAPGVKEDAPVKENTPTEKSTFGISKPVFVVIAVGAAAAIYFFLKKKKDKENVAPIPETSAVPVQMQPQQAAESNVINSFRLYAVGGCMDGRMFPIEQGEILFGRDASANVRFPADTKGVSRMHCKIFWKNGTLMLMDCDSTYGTYLKDKGKLSPQMPVPIKYGDVFYIGEKNNSFVIK